jgi:hypothetical protein
MAPAPHFDRYAGERLDLQPITQEEAKGASENKP